jgi:hypothetical protein
MNDGLEDPDDFRAGRHTISSSVKDRYNASFQTGGIDHISVEVDIEVSGARGDRPHTDRVHEEVERAVEAALRNYDGTGGER